MPNITMNQLKYEKEITEHFQDYNFDGFKEKEVLSYRWVFSDINDSRNFIPPYLITPTRKIESPTGFALSFFDSKEAGINRLKTIASNKSNMFKKLGTHIAGGTIKTTDGICCEPNNTKHFDLFEYIDTDLKTNFTILGRIS